MMREKAAGFERLLRATGYSLAGLKSCMRHEAAFRQELALSLVAVPFALWLGRTGVERALLIGSVLLVLVVELLNTAVEVVVDRVSEESHVLSGRAKDLGSAAVMLALLNALVVWLLVLWPSASTR
jgi:diacylglycerol kinase (ATP)